jgi:AraC family transcriptional regulator
MLQSQLNVAAGVDTSAKISNSQTGGWDGQEHMSRLTEQRCVLGYSDFYKNSPYAAFPQEHRQLPGRLQFHMIRVEQGAHDFRDPALPETILGLTLSASRNCTWSWDLGEGWHRDRAAAGRMLVLPADLDSCWEVSGGRRLLLLTIPSHTMRQILGPDCPPQLSSAFCPLSEATWEDPFLPTLLLRLWDASAGRVVSDRLLADGALITILSQLLQRSGVCRPRVTSSRAFCAQRLERVTDYVDAHLSDEFDLTDLAREAGLSLRHFCRSFRSEIGETPHRWIMQRRVERAKELLLQSDLSLVEIADTCGFSDQSHFTRAVKQATGTSPLRLRRERHA